MKDKDNLLNHNQWTCGEYNNNTAGFVIGTGIKAEIVNEFSTIAEKSIKIKRINEPDIWLRVVYIPEYDYNCNIKADVLSKSTSIRLAVLLDYSDSTFTLQYIDTAKSNSKQTISINSNRDLSKTITGISLCVANFDYDHYVYADNLKIYQNP